MASAPVVFAAPMMRSRSAVGRSIAGGVGGKYNDRYFPRGRVRANPSKHFVAADIGQMKIEQNQGIAIGTMKFAHRAGIRSRLHRGITGDAKHALEYTDVGV